MHGGTGRKSKNKWNVGVIYLTKGGGILGKSGGEEDEVDEQGGRGILDEAGGWDEWRVEKQRGRQTDGGNDRWRQVESNGWRCKWRA